MNEIDDIKVKEFRPPYAFCLPQSITFSLDLLSAAIKVGGRGAEILTI
jgi:hypothetical protein